MSQRVVAIAVDEAGQVFGGWGKAPYIAVCRVEDGIVSDWNLHFVDWGTSHDAGGHGSHHARIVTFLREHEVTDAMAGHMGEPMQNTLAKLGLRVTLGAEGDAKAAVAKAR